MYKLVRISEPFVLLVSALAPASLAEPEMVAHSVLFVDQASLFNPFDHEGFSGLHSAVTTDARSPVLVALLEVSRSEPFRRISRGA